VLTNAMSRYCYYTEYIFETTPEEEQTIQAIKSKIEKDAETCAATISIFSCYEPLHTLANKETLLKTHPNSLDEIVSLQIGEFNALQETKKHIQPITEIGEGVSSLVRAQYEQSPYPALECLFNDNS
jgi:hypothetical protein